MNLFELVKLIERDKATALREMTLRFRQAAKEASERARSLGLSVVDGRPEEPLPPEENWEGTPVRNLELPKTSPATDANHDLRIEREQRSTWPESEGSPETPEG